MDMYQRYSEAAGLRILGFPCNQFGGQEPGTEAEIKEFATGKYNVTFDMFSKINVNGGDAHPLWVYLKVDIKFCNENNELKLISFSGQTGRVSYGCHQMEFYQVCD